LTAGDGLRGHHAILRLNSAPTARPQVRARHARQLRLE